MKTLSVFFGVIFSFPLSVSSQTTEKIFSFRQFQELVLANHPVVKQANGLSELAKADLMVARGGFDPKFESSFDTKYFDEKSYFNFWDNVLKIPLSTGGIDLKAGFERNIGLVLGSDIRTPLDGVSYFGINIPIGQKLLIDERRNTLKNALLLGQMADNERLKIINKWIFVASKEYWNWALAHQNKALTQTFFELAKKRLALTKTRVLQGDLPAIDTSEAQVTLIDRQILFEQAEMELKNARLILSNYLWQNNDTPLEIAENAVPEALNGHIINANKLNELLDQAQTKHPDLVKLSLKTQQLKNDERLAREMLKPRLDVGITSLNYAHRLFTNVATQGNIFPNNFKAGIDFSMPLFLRKERGKRQVIKIKQWQNDLEVLQIRREISNEILTAYNELVMLEKQLKSQQMAIAQQQQILKIETQKFDIGESQLFLLNQREAKLIELQMKLEIMKAKYQKAKTTLFFAAGVLELAN